MEVFILAFLRPFVVVALHLLVVYWVARFIWWLMPDGPVKSFLFKRRGRGS